MKGYGFESHSPYQLYIVVYDTSCVVGVAKGVAPLRALDFSGQLVCRRGVKCIAYNYVSVFLRNLTFLSDFCIGGAYNETHSQVPGVQVT